MYDLELVVRNDGTTTTQPAGGWCWAKPGLRRRITVVDRDLHFGGGGGDTLTFTQTGYRLFVEAPLLDGLPGKSIDFSVTSTLSVPKANKTLPAKDITTNYQLISAVSTVSAYFTL